MNDLFQTPRSPFLRQCLDYAQRQGDLFTLGATAGSRESLALFYLLRIPESLPTFNPAIGEWEFYGSRSDIELSLAFNIQEDGHLDICAGDDGSVYQSLALTNPEDIGEILYFLKHATEEDCTVAQVQDRRLGDVVQEGYLVLPVNGDHKLLELDEAQTQCPQLAHACRQLYRGALRDWAYVGTPRFTAWMDWVGGFLATPHESLSSIRDGDMIYCGDQGFCTYRKWLCVNPWATDVDPTLALRLRTDEVSSMFFCDYCSYAVEATKCLTGIPRHVEGLKQYFGTQSVTLPRSKVQQIRTSIELRATKSECENAVNAIMREKVPFAKVVSLYGKRAAYVGLARSDYLRDIEAAKSVVTNKSESQSSQP